MTPNLTHVALHVRDLGTCPDFYRADPARLGC